MKEGKRFLPEKIEHKPAPGDYLVNGEFDNALKVSKGYSFATPGRST